MPIILIVGIKQLCNRNIRKVFRAFKKRARKRSPRFLVLTKRTHSASVDENGYTRHPDVVRMHDRKSRTIVSRGFFLVSHRAESEGNLRLAGH